MKIPCQSSLFLLLLHNVGNKQIRRLVKSYLYYIVIATATALFISVSLCAANTNAERLSLLRPLIDIDLAFNTGVATDSIILWEKLLAPELEKNKQYELLFQLKIMAVQALITQGNNSLAINNANQIYQKAKEMNDPLAMTFALRAIGNTQLNSAAPEAAIESYNEAIKIIQTLPNSDLYLKPALFKLIFIKIRSSQIKEVPNDIKRLASICSKNPEQSTDFHLSSCNAYYYIKVGNLPLALIQLQQLETLYKKYPYPYYGSMLNYLYTYYHIETKEYALAVKGFDKILQNTLLNSTYRHTQIQQERAEILALMGETQEACETYESIDARRDSLDAQSYSRQINELHAIYQVDQKEYDNLIIQKRIFKWSLSIILTILSLIIFFIFRIKRDNKRLIQSQQEQKKIKSQAEKSIRTKSLFLSNMSHEIRTPLNALAGFSSILTEESIDDETRNQCYDIIQQNSDLLLKLINDVIDLSSLEIGKMAFKFNKCEAVGLCKNVINMVEKIKQTNANVRLSTSLPSLELLTDSARLQQVLINLLINATKFTSEGSITLELEKQTEDTALFSVSDTGCGISREKQEKVFGRFEKLDENIQGTGLGLSICQLIIEQLGGKIWMDPNYSEGARFMFTHPIPSNSQEKEELK